MSVFWSDFRFALRMFLRNPGTSAVAVLSLALAIGPNATLFSVMDRLILKPPPVKGLSQLFRLSVLTDGGWESPSYADYLDYQTAAGSQADLIAYDGHGAILNANGQQEMLLDHLVTENYFSVLGVKAAAGRTLLESDRQFQGEPPLMISYSLWQRKFGGDPSVVGRTVLVNNMGFFVAGVAPRGFRQPGLGPPVDLWLPISAVILRSQGASDGFLRRDNRGLQVWVRMHSESDSPQMSAVLGGVAARLAREFPATNKGKSVYLGSAEEKEQGGRMGAMILLSLVGLVLLIAAANVAGILLARGESRAREFAVRLAMGARRLRLVRLLLAESLLLSLVAAGLGLLLAFWLVRAAPAILPPMPMSMDFDIGLDGRVLLYTLLLSLVTAIACGLAPALRVSRSDLITVLKGETPHNVGHFWFRSGLLVGQIAFCQFLLIGAGLLSRSYLEIERIRPGFDPECKLVLATFVTLKPGSAANYQQLTEALRALPGIGQVSYCKTLQLSLFGGGGTQKVSLPGVASEFDVGWNAIGPGYFSAMGTHILRGHEFQAGEPGNSAVMNEMLARRLWGGADSAIGKFFRAGGKDYQVAGVVENGKYQLILEESRPYLFLQASSKTPVGEGALLIEAPGDPKSALAAVRKVLTQTDPDLHITTLTTMREHMHGAMILPQIGAGGMGILALLGVFLAGAGLYGLMSYSVNRRMHEIGVRMALGARPSDVLKLVLRQSTLLVGVGASVGLVAAFLAARVVSSILYRVSPADPVALMAAVTAVVAVALLAAHVPARRAIRFDPMAVLRKE
jgi:predicted permease